MSRRFDDDDKYSKAKSQNIRSHATPPPQKSRPDVPPPRFASQTSSPAQSLEASEMAQRVRSKLDAVASSLDSDEPSTNDLVKGSLDRLAFASTVNNVTQAFGSVGNDALDEVGSLAHKATEQVALFNAAQYAAKWMPVDTKLTMKPTYVKVAVQSAERIKFFENLEYESIVANHLEEKNAILAENAGLRGMLGLSEKSSENVAEIRETEDGVNRALLMSAVEEIKRLRARTTVLESEAARHRMKDSGFFGLGGGSSDGVDSKQMQKLTTELARLEEDNGRQRWMIGEKDKQIKETQAKFSNSEAYALRERLQECTEALQVAGNLQAEQLQYLEDNALKKLTELDLQICDVQDDLDVRSEQLSQLRELMKRYLSTGDEYVLPMILSLAGYTKDQQQVVLTQHTQAQSKTLGGIVTGLGRFGVKLGGGAVERLLKACAPPPMPLPREGDDVVGKVNSGNAELPVELPVSTTGTPTKAAENKSGDDEQAISSSTSTAPPTSEKMDESAASSVVSSATATPVKKLDGKFESTEIAEESTEEANDTLPSPPVVSGETVATTSTQLTRPTRRPENETAAERAAREKSKQERRAKAEGSFTSSRPRGHKDESFAVFTGFEDEASIAKEKRERAAARPALPQPKLLGKAAIREEQLRKEEEERKQRIGGFEGFGGEDDSDSD